ncbi:thiosulfate sulfurtransferase [candidate division GN15 bacterium]|nr:thiosulfate sulfurtransferase [candidate division GN15 bacterium]
MSSQKQVSIDELQEHLRRPDHVLLDIRPIAAYNGWRLRNEPRGGHIQGAKTFPLSWTAFDDWTDLLEKKSIRPEMPITIYGYDVQDAGHMADRLADAGFKDLATFDHYHDWSANADLPMDHLPRYPQLVYPQWVKTLIDGNTPPEYDGQDFVICHTSYRYREDYESGHIPGAVHLDTESLEDSKTWNRRSPDELREALIRLGITRDTTVVVYGRFSHPNNEDEYPGRLAGHLAAMRCAQLLMYAGVQDVRVLNGGMAAWREAGYEMSTDEATLRPAADFGGDIPQRPNLIVDTPEAQVLLESDNGELVSVRSWEEFIGHVSGYNYIDEVGRIPGAIFGNCGSDAYHMENYRNIDHTMREYHEIAAIWAADGIVPDKHIAFYCGTGWRASEAFMHAYLMAWPRISVYDGGWMEWSSDPNNPIETGMPEDQRPTTDL